MFRLHGQISVLGLDGHRFSIAFHPASRIRSFGASRFRFDTSIPKDQPQAPAGAAPAASGHRRASNPCPDQTPVAHQHALGKEFQINIGNPA
jgi:hypothetical protein